MEQLTFPFPKQPEPLTLKHPWWPASREQLISSLSDYFAARLKPGFLYGNIYFLELYQGAVREIDGSAVEDDLKTYFKQKAKRYLEEMQMKMGLPF